jgi:enolase
VLVVEAAQPLRGRSRALPVRRLAGACAVGATKEGAHGGTMGSPMLNQLVRIEGELGDRAVYPAWGAFPKYRR